MNIETPQPETFAHHAETVTCPSCRADLARGMRFCRLCGYRLGEGLEEYVETVRLNNVAPFGAMPGGPLARHADATTRLAGAPAAGVASGGAHHRRGARGLRRLVLPVALVCAGVGGIAVLSNIGDRPAGVSAPPAPRSFFGGDEFERVDDVGLMVESVLPGGPAAAAGLYDGDIIVKLDGKPVESESDLRDALREIPVGKSVEVEYVRDGEPGRTVLTTRAADAYNPRAYVPAGGTGYWGVSSLRRVAVEGTKLHGVRLGNVSANRPADIAGLREGDIVIEFDGRPVRTRRGLGSYIDHAAPGSIVNVTVMRDGQRVVVPVKTGRD